MGKSLTFLVFSVGCVHPSPLGLDSLWDLLLLVLAENEHVSDFTLPGWRRLREYAGEEDRGSLFCHCVVRPLDVLAFCSFDQSSFLVK